MRNYKTLIIYRKGYEFQEKVFRVTEPFVSRDFELSSQIRRAALSIPLNIAEGAARDSVRYFYHFLNIAYSSGQELQVLLTIAKDRSYVTIFQFESLFKELDCLCVGIYYFLKYLDSHYVIKHRTALKENPSANCVNSISF